MLRTADLSVGEKLEVTVKVTGRLAGTNTHSGWLIPAIKGNNLVESNQSCTAAPVSNLRRRLQPAVTVYYCLKEIWPDHH
jgi:hypothetical protein